MKYRIRFQREPETFAPLPTIVVAWNPWSIGFGWLFFNFSFDIIKKRNYA